jgi:hypothetical protein
VLAKYAALHQAGVPDENLRMVLVRDNAVRADHAVLAVRHDKRWLVLDNRWNKLFEDKELKQFQAAFRRRKGWRKIALQKVSHERRKNHCPGHQSDVSRSSVQPEEKLIPAERYEIRPRNVQHFATRRYSRETQ